MLTIEHPTFDDLAGGRDADLQFLSGLAKLTAAGGGKQNDLLSGEVIAFQESIDDRGSNIPYADKIIMPTLAILFRLAICLPRKCRHFLF